MATNEKEGTKKTLEEVTLGILDELEAAVRPARYVANEEALQWVLDRLKSDDPPKELDMEWYSVGDAQATKLAESLRKNTSVTSLKLRYNEIRDAGAAALAEVLEVHPALTSLSLGNNMVGSQGAGDLARAAAASGRLKILDLKYNSMGPELPPSFVQLTGLARLDISANLLESVPPQLGCLTQLELLMLERNHNLMPSSLLELGSTADLLSAIRMQGHGVDAMES